MYLEAPVSKRHDGWFWGANAIARSPNWHRHQRARRSEARKRLRVGNTQRLCQDLSLLEGHHSKPLYTKIRSGMSWSGSGQWSGSYWGSAGRKARRGQQKKEEGKGKGKAKEERTEQTASSFPAYDAIAVQQSEVPSSSSGSTDAVWQTAFRSLLASNPGLSVPQEVSTMLGGEMKKDAKSELYEKQKILNQRRKATQRVERLQNALTRKTLQMKSYQEQLRQQLRQELERFNKEHKEIEAQLLEAREYLDKLERGEPIEDIKEPTADVTDESLMELLGIQSTDNAMIRKLMAEKEYAESAANQMQQQIQLMMNAAGGNALDPAMIGQLGALFSPKRSSPQLPRDVPPLKKPKPGEKTEIVIDDEEGLGAMDG